MASTGYRVVALSALGSRAVDFCGFRSGELTAIAPLDERSGKNRVWACRCDCGGLTKVSTCNLRSGSVSSCGCARGESRVAWLKGRIFGRLRVLERVPGEKGGHVKWLCHCSCGGATLARSDSLLRGEWLSCGCRTREHAAELGRRQKGALNPNWAGGVTPRNHLLRHSIEYRNWRDAVFARDSHTCRSCGRRGGVLNAHHVKSFALFPRDRLNVSNGVTLCKECHRALHVGIHWHVGNYCLHVDGGPLIAKRMEEGVYDDLCKSG